MPDILPLADFANVGTIQKVWTKPGLTQQEFRVDRYACERDMRQSGYYGTGLAGAIEMRNFFSRCMESKGYMLVPADQVEQTFR